MLLSPRKNGLASLFKEVRAFKVGKFLMYGFTAPLRALLRARSLGLLEAPLFRALEQVGRHSI